MTIESLPSTPFRLDVALIHFPVVNRGGECIGSAVTNLDLHDIARAARTFGVDTYWVVTPHEEQRQLAESIVDHWINGYGSTANPHRGDALSLIRICSTLDDVLEAVSRKWEQEVLTVATCARKQENTVGYPELGARIREGEPTLLLFGTAWGLAPDLLRGVRHTLPPISGVTGYNHLSVRSAVSITLDRLLGR